MAQQEALAQLGAAGYRESVVQGEMVEVRAGLEFGEEFESSRWLVKILQCDPINRRCEIEYVDFDDEETPGKKLTDWVDYWAVRPIPPNGVRFGLHARAHHGARSLPHRCARYPRRECNSG